MSQTVRIRRGLKSELNARGALLTAEMGFCTDTKEVFIGDGAANHLVGKALSGDYASRPNAANSGRFYYVSTGTTNLGYLYIDDGSAWHVVNVLKLSDLTGTLDDIANGATYAKVKLSELTNGQVNRLSDGTTTVTVAVINTHINDAVKHRVINDSGTSNIDLWSAQKIRNEIELAKHNIEPQASVKDKDLLTPPGTPTVGDRYIVASGTATGTWVSKNNQIAEWNGSSWNFYSPSTGWTCYVDDEQKVYSWNGAARVRTGGALQTIVAGNGLTGGGQADTVTLNIGAGNGIAVTADKGITVSSSGVAANIDGDSMQYDSANGNRLMVVNIDGGTF